MLGMSHQGAPIDRYVVLEYLSEGGMGAIYLGKKMGAGGFEKEVVLKQLLPEFTQQPEFIELFLREARLSASLDHANIIHTIDLVTAGPDHFIVMEFLDGADLRTLIKKARLRHGRFSASAGIYIAREVLSALSYAHSKLGPDGRPLRLIHRDVSPSNILVSKAGEVKLTDFGIAKAATHNSVFYRVKGKVGYMSPEQAKSEHLDHRSDLYSLAVCLYELITGERLFVAAGLTTSAEEIYSQPVPLLSRKIKGLPPELDKVMLKALSIDPDHRYQTATAFQEALLRCAHRTGLLISAPELAAHLREICGTPSRWRDLEAESAPHRTAAMRGGTEVYDNFDEGTEQLDPRELGDDVLSAVYDDAMGPLIKGFSRKEAVAKRTREQTSLTSLSRLQGMELTSMINIAGGDAPGAQPLVDLDTLGEGSAPSSAEAVLDDLTGSTDIGALIDHPAPRPSARPRGSRHDDATGSRPLDNDDLETVGRSGGKRRGWSDDSGSVVLATAKVLRAGANQPRATGLPQEKAPRGDITGVTPQMDGEVAESRRGITILIVLALAAAIGAAVAIGMSGPELPPPPAGSATSPK